ncbi:hypothetical protein GALL_397820 [mine drainage metagenome]|uniref:LytR/CpsA/Psr regulator C-terminal domain-containing protein n=1 Tax=mine drainage metagenome TaxID=410659 RepID=A0A1J5Q5J6_9ZZZZ
MSKARYPYPDDEFDAVDDHAAPRGVHRRARSVWTRVWPFLLVIVLFPAIAYGIVTLLTGTDMGLSGGAGLPSAGVSSTAEPSTTATATTSAAPGTPTTSPTTTPPAAADLRTAVAVDNATKTSGLAAKGAAALRTAGFTTITTGNYTGTAPATSTVYYASAKLAATARAAAAALKITTVTLDPAKAGSTIVVVLAKDYTP